MLLLLKTGEAKSRSAAVRQLGPHRSTVANWLDLYVKGGLEKLQEIGEPGPEPSQQSIPSGVVERPRKRLSEPEG